MKVVRRTNYRMFYQLFAHFHDSCIFHFYGKSQNPRRVARQNRIVEVNNNGISRLTLHYTRGRIRGWSAGGTGTISLTSDCRGIEPRFCVCCCCAVSGVDRLSCLRRMSQKINTATITIMETPTPTPTPMPIFTP